MPPLKTLQRSLSPLPSRLGFPPGDARAQDQARNRLAPWRRWYSSKRWRDLRTFVFRRDGYRCRQTGALCSGVAPAPNSPVADHIRPHRGDPKLFWDPNNIQTVTKAWHDREKQTQERAAETRGGSEA